MIMKKAALFFGMLNCFCGSDPSIVKGEVEKYIGKLKSMDAEQYVGKIKYRHDSIRVLCDTLCKKIDSGEIEEFEQLDIDKLSDGDQEELLDMMYDHLDKDSPNLTTKKLRSKISSYQLEQENKLTVRCFLRQSAWFVLTLLISGLVVLLLMHYQCIPCVRSVRINGIYITGI